MSLDLAVLQCLKWRDTSDKISRFVIDGNHDKSTILLAKDFKRYWHMHPEDELVDMDVFRSLFYNKWHKTTSPESRQTYDVIFDRICDDLTTEQQANIVNSLIELDVATEIANDVSAYQEGDDIDLVSRIDKRIETAKEMMESSVTLEHATLDTLEEEGESTISYGWPLKCLADKLRNVVGGDQIIVAARSDVGKTSLTLQLAVCWAKYQQLYLHKKPILWFNNEGSKFRVLYRAYGMMLGLTRSQIDSLKFDGTLRQHLTNAMGTDDAIRIYDIHTMSDYQLEELIKRVHKETGIGGVVWDMADNVKFAAPSSASRTDEILEEKYKWTRQTGVIYDYPVINTSQASADAEGEKWPELSMLKDSKTGKQGASDMVLFIGMETDPARAAFRYLSAPKNKLAKEGASGLREEVTFNRDVGICLEL